MVSLSSLYFFFFFLNNPATPEISPLSLPDALPISGTARLLLGDEEARVLDSEADLQDPALRTHQPPRLGARECHRPIVREPPGGVAGGYAGPRSEEHTSELQSRLHLLCRLLLEKKK